MIDEFDERSPTLTSPTGRVDSIDSISKKISNLGTELISFCPDNELVIDSYAEVQSEASLHDDSMFGFGNLEIDYRALKQTARRTSMSTREKEKKDRNKFAGVYSLRTVMEKNENPLNVGAFKPPKNQEKKLFGKIQKNQTTVSKKPMLVELHTFPGFIADELTPLPVSLSAKYVLNIVTSAQKDLAKKPGFKKEFKKMFLSHSSQAVLQDIFWWFFIEKYQSCPEVQSQLFSRVACSYVKLIINGSEYVHRETFFKRFPSLVCQAVYTVFCRAFPTSYRQFDDRFKQDLADITYLWIAGTRPVRRCWERWPLTFLEPEGMNKEEEIQKNVSKEFALGLFDLESDHIINHPSHDSLNAGKPERRRKISKVYDRHWTGDETTAVHPDEETVKRKVSLRSVNDKYELIPINEIARKPSLKVPCDNLEPCRHEKALTEKGQKPSDTKLNISKSFQSTRTSNSSLLRSTGTRKRESCYAGKGPEFQKVVFDLHGQSPLVKHFLQNKRLAKDSGTSILVQRTEIEKLPPINAPTYRDIIKDSLKSSHELEKQIQSLLDQMSNERAMFGKQLKKEREEFRKKETQVLSRQKEVKKISDLILLRLAKGQNGENDRMIASSIANALKLDDET